MKSESAVLEVLFPKIRAELLRTLFAAPQKPRYVRELVNISGLALCTVQDELRKLSAIGLVVSWSNGYHRFYRANRDHGFFEHLLGLVQVSEKLPKTKQSALRRRPERRPARQRKPRKLQRLSVDQPLNWQLFSKPTKT